MSFIRTRRNGILGASLFVILALFFLFPVGTAAQTYTWTTQVIDIEGGDSSIVVDHDGNIHVSYHYPTHAVLKYAFLPAGSSHWFTMPIDDLLGDFLTRITVDDKGNPYICYSPKVLKFAHFDGGHWSVQQIDPGNGVVNYYCSVRVGANGDPQVSWYVESGVWLRYAVLHDGVWTARNIDAEGGPGKFNSMVLDAQGNPHVSYIGLVGVKLKYAHFDGKEWIRTIVDSQDMDRAGLDRGMGNSIALDSHGNPMISYFDTGSLKFARLQNGKWNLERIDTFPPSMPWSWRSFRSTVMLDRQGNPHIGYESVLGIKHAWWDGTKWHTQLILGPSGITTDGSMTMDAKDNLYFCYTDPVDRSLKLAIGHFTPSEVSSDAVAKEKPSN
jgi:hypothetical protein